MTTYAPRVTRDGSDFLAECVEWSADGQIVNTIFVGWFDSHELARAAADAETTDCYTRDANDQLEAISADRDADVARAELGICDEELEDGEKCGCIFELAQYTDKWGVSRCPACNSCAIIELDALDARAVEMDEAARVAA